MAIEQDFVPFAAGAGANVLTQAEYLALAELATGFASGEAYSAQLNKVWRQSSIMASVLATVIANVTGQNAIDDGTTTDLVGNLVKTLLMGGGFGTDAGAANAYIVTLPIAPLSLQAGMVVRFVAANANTGASTLDLNGLGAVSILGQAGGVLQGGEIAAAECAMIYTGTEFVLIWSNGGILQVPPATASGQAVNLGQIENGSLSGTILNNVTTISTSTVLTNSNLGIVIDTAGSITITLPTPSVSNKGGIFKIINASSGALTFDTISGNINGLSSISVVSNFGECTLISDGSTWRYLGVLSSTVNAYSTVNLTTPSTGWTIVPLNTKNLDPLDEFNTTSYYFSPKISGWYKISMITQINAPPANVLVAFGIFLGGASSPMTYLAQTYLTATSQQCIVGSSQLLYLQSGSDYYLEVATSAAVTLNAGNTSIVFDRVN